MADPVDLSGKQGVVDPRDLKKDDPKPPKLEPHPPPAPNSGVKPEHYSVHTTGEGHGGVPTSGGFGSFSKGLKALPDDRRQPAAAQTKPSPPPLRLKKKKDEVPKKK